MAPLKFQLSRARLTVIQMSINGSTFAQGQTPGFIYSRNTNPTVAAFEEKCRQLEGAQAATSFASGMAAISNTLFSLLRPGDRLVSVKDTYGGTNQLFQEFLPHWGVKVELCDTDDYDQIEGAIMAGCRLLYLENSYQSYIESTGYRALFRSRQSSRSNRGRR